MSKNAEPLLLSIIVPVYNEALSLEQVVEYLMASRCLIAREWIFVDDCSTDGSFEILQALSRRFSFRLLKHDQNEGKGAALRRGIAEAKGQFILVQDADFEYDPNDTPNVVQPLIDGRADVVYGSRFRQSSVTQVHRTYHYFINRFLTLLSNLFSGIYLTDMETCYKAFRSDLLQNMTLTSNRFGIEVELTAYLAKVRARIVEVPISYYPRTRLQGKKINWKDGFAALRHLVYFNWWVDFDAAYNTSRLPETYHPKFNEVKKPVIGSNDS